MDCCPLTQAVDGLFSVHQLDGDITLGLVYIASTISCQVNDYCCSHHGVGEVSLE